MGVVSWRLSVPPVAGGNSLPAHASALHDVVERRLADPDSARQLLEEVRRIRSGEYPSWFVDFVEQRSRGEVDVYSAHCIAALYGDWQAGRLVKMTIDVRAKPLSDRCREENARVLEALPRPFSAVLAPGADGDGTLSWSEPVTMQSDREGGEVAPSSAMLEVGTTSASRTLLHMRRAGALARWPYGSREIIVLCAVDTPGAEALAKRFARKGSQ
jgi:hypothetical protein